MRKIIVAIALMLSLTFGGFATSPASATTCPTDGTCFGGQVNHIADAGYDPSIIIFCNWGDYYITNPDGSFTPRADRWQNEHYVGEGSTSKSDCGVDTDIIYLRAGEHLVCHYSWSKYSGWLWETVFDATGVHKISDAWRLNVTDGRSCALKKDT